MKKSRETASVVLNTETSASIPRRTTSHNGPLQLPPELNTSLQRSDSGASGAHSTSTASRTPTPLKLSGESGSMPPSPRHTVSDVSVSDGGRQPNLEQQRQQHRGSGVISPTPSSHGGLLTPQSDSTGGGAQRSPALGSSSAAASPAVAAAVSGSASSVASGRNPTLPSPRHKPKDVVTAAAPPPSKNPKRSAPSPRSYGGAAVAGGRRWFGAGVGSASTGGEAARLRALQKQPLFKFMVAVRAMMFLFKLRHRILTVRRALRLEIFLKPRAAFAIQCAFRRMRAKRRWSLADAAMTILRFLRPRAVRIVRARRQKVMLLQKVCRAFGARRDVFDQWKLHRRTVVHRVLRRRLQICVAKHTLEHLRAMLEERRLFEHDAANTYRSLFRQERQEFTDDIRRAASASLQVIRNRMQSQTLVLQQRVAATQALIAAADRAARMSNIYSSSSPRHSSNTGGGPSHESGGVGFPEPGVTALYVAGGGGEGGNPIVEFSGSYMIQVLGASFATLRYADSDHHSPSHHESFATTGSAAAAAVPTPPSGIPPRPPPLTDAFNGSLGSLTAAPGGNAAFLMDHTRSSSDDAAALDALTQAIVNVTKQMTALAAVADHSDADECEECSDSGGEGSASPSPGPVVSHRAGELRLDGLTLVSQSKWKRRRGARRSTIAPAPSELLERRRRSSGNRDAVPVDLVHIAPSANSTRLLETDDSSVAAVGSGGSPACSSAGSASSPVNGDAVRSRSSVPLSSGGGRDGDGVVAAADSSTSSTPRPASDDTAAHSVFPGIASRGAYDNGLPLTASTVPVAAATAAATSLPVVVRKSSANTLAAADGSTAVASSSRWSASSLSATESATDTVPKPSPSGTAPRTFSLFSTLPESNSSFSSPLGDPSPSSEATPEGLVGRHDSGGSGVLDSHPSSQHLSSNASLAMGSLPSRSSWASRSSRRRASRTGQAAAAAATVITDELGRAYGELLEATEAIERKQLQASMLSNVRDMHRHVEWCIEVLCIRDSVPRPFFSLLPHLAPSWILHLAVALFTDEEAARAVIVEEYESTPLMFLSRPIMGVNSEKRRRRMKELLLQRAAALFEAHVSSQSQMASSSSEFGGKSRGGRRLSLAASAVAAATQSRNSVSPENSFNGSLIRHSPSLSQPQQLSPTVTDRDKGRRSSIAISLVVTNEAADSAEGNLAVLPPMHAKSSRGSTVSTHSLGEHRIGLPSSPGRRETMALPTKSSLAVSQVSPFETSLRARHFANSPRHAENSPAVSGGEDSGPVSNSNTPRTGARRLASFASVVEAAAAATASSSSSPSSRIRGSVFCGGGSDSALDSPRRHPRPPPSGAFEALRLSLSNNTAPWLTAAAGGGGGGRNSSSSGGGRGTSFGSLFAPTGDELQLLNNSLRRSCDDSPSRLGNRHDPDTPGADEALAGSGGRASQLWRAPHAPLRGVVSPPTAVLGFPVRPPGREISTSFVSTGAAATPSAISPSAFSATASRAQRTKVTFSVAPPSTASSSAGEPEDGLAEALHATRLPEFVVEIPRSSASGADLMVRRKGSNWT